MAKKAYRRYQWIQGQVETDAEYRALKRRLETQESAFFAVMENLTEDQQQTIHEYIGLCAELDERELEIACFAEW